MLRLIGYVLVFVVGFVCLDSLDKWGQAELLKQEQQQVVECTTDAECMEKNPHLEGY